MQVIDGQVHDPSPWIDWTFGDESRRVLVCELTLAAMDAVGVAAAVIAPRHDPTFGELAVSLYPDRFARVVMVDAAAPDLDDVVARTITTPGVVGLRTVVADYAGDRGATDLREGKFDRLFAAAERRRAPLFLLGPGFPGDLARAAEAHPGLPMIVDHFGLRQYPPLSMDTDPWEKLPGLLALAPFPNVHVKFCGPQLLSAEPYPHADVWPRLHEVVDAFGAGRLLWASDFTRLRMVPAGEPWKSSYAEALFLVRDTTELSAQQKELILGGTLRRLLAWPPAPPD